MIRLITTTCLALWLFCAASLPIKAQFHSFIPTCSFSTETPSLDVVGLTLIGDDLPPITEAAEGPLEANYNFEVFCLTALFTNTSDEALSFRWGFGDGDTAYVTHPTHVYEYPGTYITTLEAINGVNGLVSFSDTIVVDYCSDITSIVGQTFNYAVYPNPATKGQSINFEFNQLNANHQYQLLVYNMLGQQMQMLPYSANDASKRLEVSTWPGGLYVYQLVDETGKVLVENKLMIGY